MYVVNSDGLRALAPGFLVGCRFDAMMPEYSRYMMTLPLFLAAHLAACVTSAYGLATGSMRYILLAYAIVMTSFSVRMLGQRLVRVGFREPAVRVTSAPTAVRLNACLGAASLSMIGGGILTVEGANEAPPGWLGILLMTLAVAWALALRRRRGHAMG